MSFDVERIYALLPAIYRSRDADQGYPLKGLLSLIAEQVSVIEEDLDQLYDDQFIETCAEWVVPYIGDLIGARGVYGLTPSTFSQRAQVANTIGYRRRKGTLAVIEDLATTVTGWNARAVEFFKLLATSQYMNHIRLENVMTPDMGEWEPLERLGTPFESSAHTADVRRIASGRGRYNIPNIGIFIWRIVSYPLTSSPVFSLGDGQRFLFNPLGINTQLYTRPLPEESVVHIAGPSNAPLPISRRVLDRYLKTYYGIDKSLHLRFKGAEVKTDKIQICDLSDDPSGSWANTPVKDKDWAIDPILGRIASKDIVSPEDEVCVSFHYGFSADMGGGEYSRIYSFTTEDRGCSALRVTKVQSPMCRTVDTIPGAHPDVQSAWSSISTADTCDIIEIVDSGTYRQMPVIALPVGRFIEIRAAEGCRPAFILNEDTIISGGEGSRISINGLLISGGTIRISGEIDRVTLKHCTLVPGLSLKIDGSPESPGIPSLIIESKDAEVVIDSCTIGRISAVEGARVKISNSIVDATSETGIAYSSEEGPDPLPGAVLDVVKNCTIIGKVRTVGMSLVSNTIFLAGLEAGDEWESPIWSDRRQEGCIRFSYLPPGSRVPRRYMCQPDLAERAGEDRLRAKAGLILPGPDEIAAAREAERVRVRPQMTSVRYGDPGYCQIGKICAVEIKTGAHDESEMGAFHDLYQPQRETNLRMRLEKYLRFGLEAGIFYES